jgi:hypothetical protein
MADTATGGGGGWQRGFTAPRPAHGGGGADGPPPTPHRQLPSPSPRGSVAASAAPLSAAAGQAWVAAGSGLLDSVDMDYGLVYTLPPHAFSPFSSTAPTAVFLLPTALPNTYTHFPLPPYLSQTRHLT